MRKVCERKKKELLAVDRSLYSLSQCLIVLTISLVFYVKVDAQKLFPVKLNKKWGLINQNGQVVIDPVYDAIGEFIHFGSAIMQRNGKVGLLNHLGAEIINPQYEDLKVLDSTLVAVFANGSWKVVNTNEEIVLEAGYEQIKILDKGYIAFKKNGSWGIARADGIKICNPEFSEMKRLYKDYFIVRKMETIGLIDGNGTFLLDPEYQEVKVEKEKYFFFRKADKWGALTFNGQTLFLPQFQSYSFISNELIKLRKDKLFALFSISQKKFINSSWYDNYYPLLDKYVLCKKNRLLGLIDLSGEEILPVLYDEILSLGKNHFRVQQNGKWGVVKIDNALILPLEYDYISPFKHGLALLKKGEKFGALNARGETIIEVIYDKILLKPNRIEVFKGEALSIFYLKEDGTVNGKSSFGSLFTVKVRKKHKKKPPFLSPENEQYVLDKFEWFYSSADDKWGLRNLENGTIQIKPTFDWINVVPDQELTVVGKEQLQYHQFGTTTFRSDWVFGIVNNKFGELVTEADLLDVRLGDFKEKTPLVRIINNKGKHGLINPEGKIVLDGLAYIGRSKDGIFRVATKGKLTAVKEKAADNYSLELLSSYLNNQLSNFTLTDHTNHDREISRSGQLICQNCKWGYLRDSGQVLVEATYNFANEFVNGVGIVSDGQKWGAVGINGDVLIPCNYDEIHFLENTGNKILRIYHRKQQYGLIDTSGSVTVRTMYDEIGGFNEGRLSVRREKWWGFADRRGIEVIPPRFRKVHAFSEGMAAVQLGFKWGYIDKQGDVVIDFEYQRVGNFHDGLAWVSTSHGYGYIDKKGEMIIPGQFDQAFDFEDGLARVVMNGKYGLINLEGKFIVRSGRFSLIEPFNEHELSLVCYGNDRIRYGLINRKGELVTSQGYQKIYPFYDGFAAVKTNKHYGFIDTKGDLVIKDKYAKVSRFSGDRAAVWKCGYCGYIDPEGKEVVELEYLKCLDYKGGKAVIYKNDQKTGLIDRWGNYIIKPTINKLLDFSDGRGLVQDRKYRFYYITEEAKMSEGYYTHAGKFSNGIAVVELDGRWGIINQRGIQIVPPKYDKIEDFEDGYAKVRIKGFNGLINLDGELIVQPEYEYISYAGEGLFRIEQGGKIGYCNEDGNWIWGLTE